MLCSHSYMDPLGNFWSKKVRLQYFTKAEDIKLPYSKSYVVCSKDPFRIYSLYPTYKIKIAFKLETIVTLTPTIENNKVSNAKKTPK